MNSTEAREAIDRLFTWSTNYDFPSPACLFLDLIGHSEETLGERLCSQSMPSIGYLEAGYLGEALTAWSDFPSDVHSHVEQLLAEEAEA
tara:strand:+ start:302 stop:568 length:267 start_codon:yes stop_codon:yes gene_type:complete